ncbi:MAG: hypothetical protein HN404_02335 [Gemmatimonadetes bacterium]|nr:hypothetical protein [Gemmatimonadota bacterium]
MLYPDTLIQRLRNDEDVPRRAIERVAPWNAYSDDDLWHAVFGPTITRSWMVLSDGHCPACGGNANMYDWQIDPFTAPWKALCPTCSVGFPRNDFATFYRSGLDERGLFDPARADRTLLVDADGRSDLAGIDDGEGYREGDRVWRFIGTYLIYGQWKRLIVEGVERLAAAWVATGQAAYARRAGLLLDRISDVYPDFDFGAQAILYEQPGHRGYVSTWHDACHEIQRLTIAYNQIRPALLKDKQLVEFLARKADAYQLPTPKDSGAQICDNIESRILQDTLDHNDKIESNFPTTEVARILIHATLAGATSDISSQIDELFDDILTRGTAVDGVSGEKGLAGYAAIAPRSIAASLSLFARADADFLPRILKRHPRLHEHFRFHIDTWVAQAYYPNVGDSGAPGRPGAGFVGPHFDRERQDPLAPSTFTFFWQLFEATGDSAFVQVLVHANDGDTQGLPHDPTCADTAAFRQQVEEVMAQVQTAPLAGSVNKPDYHLAILRSDDEVRGPVAWLDYDSGALNSVYAHRLDPNVRGRGAHSHADGMNLGLYYRGLDLMHDFGYPPVNYGGWNSPRAEWAKRTISHNTVTIDGLDQANAGGTTSWWLDGPFARGISVSAPGLINRDDPTGLRFERTILLVPTAEDEGYIVDSVHLVGGSLQQRFIHAGFGPLTMDGVNLQEGSPDPGLADEPLLRAWHSDANGPRGWTADWQLNDHYDAALDEDIHLRYTDLSDAGMTATCQSWSLHGYYGERNEEWIERVLQQRRGEAPLQSSFIGILEPYVKAPQTQARRLDENLKAAAALEVSMADGRRDVILLGDPLEETGSLTCDRTGDKLHLSGQLGVVRFGADGLPTMATLIGSHLEVGDLRLEHTGSGAVSVRLDDPDDSTEHATLQGWLGDRRLSIAPIVQ